MDKEESGHASPFTSGLLRSLFGYRLMSRSFRNLVSGLLTFILLLAAGNLSEHAPDERVEIA